MVHAIAPLVAPTKLDLCDDWMQKGAAMQVFFSFVRRIRRIGRRRPAMPAIILAGC